MRQWLGNVCETVKQGGALADQLHMSIAKQPTKGGVSNDAGDHGVVHAEQEQVKQINCRRCTTQLNVTGFFLLR